MDDDEEGEDEGGDNDDGDGDGGGVMKVIKHQPSAAAFLSRHTRAFQLPR